MTVLPIVARELRVAARAPGVYRIRTGAASLAIAVCGLVLAGLSFQAAGAQGRTLLSVLSLGAFVYCALAGTRATSDCLSGEKREGTLGLLFLTDLKGYDVVLGKLVSCSLSGFYGLLGIVPVLALALLLGGVTLRQVADLTLLFLNTLFFSMAAGVFASSLSRNDRRAMFATGCLIFGWFGGPFVVAAGYAAWGAYHGTPPESLGEFSAIFKASPVYAFQLVRGSMVSRFLQREFYDSVLITFVAGCALLGATSWLLPRIWRERPPKRVRSWWRRCEDRWNYGSRKSRTVFRARLLDRNPYYWLAARSRIKACYAWCLALAFGAVWLMAGWRLRSFAFDWSVSLLFLFLFLGLFKVWFASEVCSRLAEDRASGAFELLLSSPLGEKELARGLSLALWRQFGWPSLVTVGVALFLLASALRTAHFQLETGELKLLYWGSLFLFAADLVTLQWTGLWQSLISRNIQAAMGATCGRVLLLPTLLFVAGHTVIWLYVQLFGSQSMREVPWAWTALLWLGIGLLTDLVCSLTSRRRYYWHFRELATERFAVPHSRPGWRARLSVIAALLRGPQGRATNSSWSGWRRRFVLGTTLLLMLALIGFSLWRYAQHRELQARFASIRAVGQPLSAAELIRSLPAIPEQRNAGILLREAGPTLTLPARWPDSKLVDSLTALDLRAWTWVGPLASPSPDLVAVVSNVVKQNQISLRLLHRAAPLMESRFPLDWNTPAPQVQFGSIRHAAPLLQVEAWWCLHQDDREGALQSVWALLGLARALGQEPFDFTQDQHSRALNAAIGVLEQLLAKHTLSLEELEALAKAMAQAERMMPRTFARGVIADRCLTLDALRGDRLASMGLPSAGWEAWTVGLLQQLGRISGFTDGYLIEYLDAVSPWIEFAERDTAVAAATPWPKSIRESLLLRRHGRYRNLDSFLQYRWNQQRTLMAQLRVSRCVIAIEQFRAGHEGRVPESVEELGLPATSRVLEDPFAPGGMRYRRLESGYLVYSLGPDGKDSGGVEQKRQGATTYDLPFSVRR